MIALTAAGFCYAAFLLFETFALALDRLSPIKIRGLLEEHPELGGGLALQIGFGAGLVFGAQVVRLP